MGRCNLAATGTVVNGAAAPDLDLEELPRQRFHQSQARDRCAVGVIQLAGK
jgi:hypothetical protein